MGTMQSTPSDPHIEGVKHKLLDEALHGALRIAGLVRLLIPYASHIRLMTSPDGRSDIEWLSGAFLLEEMSPRSTLTLCCVETGPRRDALQLPDVRDAPRAPGAAGGLELHHGPEAIQLRVRGGRRRSLGNGARIRRSAVRRVGHQPYVLRRAARSTSPGDGHRPERIYSERFRAPTPCKSIDLSVITALGLMGFFSLQLTRIMR